MDSDVSLDVLERSMILSKRPRSPVAADLDTANILSLEHRRKQIKPVRGRE